MTKNIFYFYRINSIGGIESFFYNLAYKYQDHDIEIYYRTGDEQQIKRLSKYVRVRKWNGERIQCEKAFFNFNVDIIDYVDAKEYIQIAHGDYKAMGITPNTHPKITKYLGVSQLVCDTFREVTGYDVELAYNPLVIQKPRKILHLISCTRLTAEKGKGRIVKLAEAFDRSNILYNWVIYTDDADSLHNKNIVYRRPRLDIIDQIADADYLVQLSDNEGYCYSVVEALSVGTPVIVTDCPVFREIGVNRRNGFILDFNMTDVPVEEIYKGLPRFEYKQKEDRWDQILAKGESQYKKDMQTMVRIRCVSDYYDLEMNRQVKKNELLEVNKVRAEVIVDSGFAEFIGGDSHGVL